MRCGRVVCTNYSLLYGHLDPKKLLCKLPEKGLIDEEDLVIVESFHQKFAKNVFFIRSLLWYDRPSHGLLKFCDTLETTPGQEYIGRKLLKGMFEIGSTLLTLLMFRSIVHLQFTIMSFHRLQATISSPCTQSKFRHCSPL